MRKQYHFRHIDDDTYIWDVHHLVELSRNLPIQRVSLADIQELTEPYWFPHTAPTTQQIIEHMQLVQAADLSYPIILCASGRVMDGMHRIAKAVLNREVFIQAVQFTQTPEPDFINLDEDELDYEDD
ncbi:hypothetical protein [Acinetobacter sp.]|uniref:hypothetical protein n=1 Tax=Acinetobacter sp. TaxID=472 RepID=UPI0035ADF34F